MKRIGRLHVLTDFHFQQRFPQSELARMAIDGGAETIQFRQKHGSIRDILREAHRVARVCREVGATILINDRVDVAMAVQANGVHLGQTDFPVAEARRVLGAEPIIGASATTLAEAIRAQEEGADYIGFGPVYPTASKDNPASVKGLAGLTEVARKVRIPVIAIAGMSAQRALDVLRAGAHGLAVMTAVSLAQDPEEAVREIRAAIDSFPDDL